MATSIEVLQKQIEELRASGINSIQKGTAIDNLQRRINEEEARLHSVSSLGVVARTIVDHPIPLTDSQIRAEPVSVGYGDTPSVDAYARLRISQPSYIFGAQLTYDLQPLLYEQITSGTGATVTFDTTNRDALMTFSSTPTGGQSYMQTFEHFRYSSGKGQLVIISFNMIAAVANVVKFAGYSDGTEGLEFQLDGTTKQFRIYSTTTSGGGTVTQDNWNLDKLDGTGESGITLDITKVQMFVIDFQGMHAGRVRVGFYFDGEIVYAHKFNGSNTTVYPGTKTVNLPVRAGMTCTGTVNATMNLTGVSVAKEDGGVFDPGYLFTQDSGLITAANGARTHALSIQPRLTFNSITNRTALLFQNIALLVTGNNPVHWELCLGDVLTGTTTFNNVNTVYSAVDYNTAGTTSGTPAIILDCGFVAASNQAKGNERSQIPFRYPICLNAAGAARSLGRLTLLLTGIGAASDCYAAMSWNEIR